MRCSAPKALSNRIFETRVHYGRGHWSYCLRDVSFISAALNDVARFRNVSKFASDAAMNREGLEKHCR